VLKLSSPETGGFWEIPILYEDADLLALSKPGGLPLTTDPAGPNRAALMQMLQTGIAESKPWATTRSLSFLRCAHRVADEDSGILLLAKNKPVLVTLMNVFGSEQPSLSFVTLVQGAPAEDRFLSEAKIGSHATKPGLMRVDARAGKRARTSFEVIERFQGWTLLKCTPLTYRPHQIRVHLSRMGLRVAGDDSYGGKPLLLSSLKPNYHLKPNHSERPLIGSPCLHAEELAIAHPVTGQPLLIKAPWPKDLLVAIKYLRKFAIPT
jgi:23S rRNA pseudouridine955/2504/2580 synthase